MTRIESKFCIKCGSSKIKLNTEKFVCSNCGLIFCLFEENGETK